MKSLICPIIILIIISCTQQDIMIGRNILIKEFPQEINLSGEKLDITSIGVNNIFVVDTFLICYKAMGLDEFFDIYSTNTYQSLGKFLSPGRGPNEFLNATYMGQHFKDSSNTYMWIKDEALMKLTLFNLTESVKQHKTIIDSCIYLSNSCIGNNYIIGDTLISIVNSSSDLFLSSYNLQKDSPLEQPIIMFRDPLKNIQEYIFGMNIQIHPNRTKFISAMSNFNQINIFSPNFTDITTLSIYKPTISIKEISLTPDIERIRYYSNVFVTNSSIYALYINKPTSIWREHEKSIEIQEFTWNGTPVRKFTIPNDIIYFTLDQKHKYIYGFKDNEEIYKYDISNYI